MTRAGQTGAAVGSGVLVAWAWNATFPETPMPAEVAAVVGAVIAPLYEGTVAALNAVVARIGGGHAEDPGA